jgi:hypothetical protein
MPDYRPGAPSVDLFTPDEHLVLCDWFGVDCPRSGRWIWEVLDEWNIPEEVYRHERTGAAVAQILLERIQDRLPDCAGPTGSARPVFDRRAHRKVELWPRHLLTINWADSAPGVSWPVAYKATYVPGFDRTVLTASADCTEIFGVCDVAIGTFGPEVSILQGSRDVIVSDWSWQRGEWVKASSLSARRFLANPLTACCCTGMSILWGPFRFARRAIHTAPSRRRAKKKRSYLRSSRYGAIGRP